MDPRIERALGIIEREFQKPWTIEAVARSVGISRSHLEFLFKKEAGLTLKACIREKRLKQAAESLTQAHPCVKEVAFQAGYRYSSSFDREFRKRFGKSPSEYQTR